MPDWKQGVRQAAARGAGSLRIGPVTAGYRGDLVTLGRWEGEQFFGGGSPCQAAPGINCAVGSIMVVLMRPAALGTPVIGPAAGAMGFWSGVGDGDWK